MDGLYIFPQALLFIVIGKVLSENGEFNECALWNNNVCNG
jgi:hypothetical protein